MIEIWQSDMRVKFKQKRSKSKVVYDIVVTTDNDDASRSPHLIFSLPRNSRVQSVRVGKGHENTSYQIYGNASQGIPPGTAQIDGYVKVDFANLNKERVRIRIVAVSVRDGWRKGDGASAFVYSLTPELNKRNNFVYLPL